MSDQKDAKKTGELKVPPDALLVVYLDEISSKLSENAELLKKTLTHLQETTPEGIDMVVFEGTITAPGRGIDPVRDFPYRLLFKIDVINNGPGTIYVRVNEEKEVRIDTDESIVFDKGRAKIKYILIRLDTGNEASVKILGRY